MSRIETFEDYLDEFSFLAQELYHKLCAVFFSSTSPFWCMVGRSFRGRQSIYLYQVGQRQLRGTSVSIILTAAARNYPSDRYHLSGAVTIGGISIAATPLTILLGGALAVSGYSMHQVMMKKRYEDGS